MYSYGPPHMAGQKQDDQLEHTYSSYGRIRDVALKTCQRRWTIGRSGERGSGISVLAARDDDDDDDVSDVFFEEMNSKYYFRCNPLTITAYNPSEIAHIMVIEILICWKILLFRKILLCSIKRRHYAFCICCICSQYATSPVGWDSRIHQLHLCREIRPLT